MKAVLLVSHGSRSSKTKQEVHALVRALKHKTRIKIFEYAFLDVESPTIPKGLDRCVGKGATEVMVLLNFLNSGRHVDRDIPAIVRKAQKKYGKVKLTMSQPIGQHPQIACLFVDLINPP